MRTHDFNSPCAPDLPTVFITAPERDGDGYPQTGA